MLAVDTVDLFRLSRRKLLRGIEAPRSLEQSLAPEHLMAARNAAGKFIRHVEEGAVAIGHPGIQRQQCFIHRSGFNSGEQIHGGLGPHAPMSEESALDPD